MDIEELGLSVRAYNAVKRYGFNTTEELAERIDEFCKHAPKFGAEAREALSKVSVPQPSGVIVESAEYTRAIRLHRCICANAQAAQESLYEMCKALKEMRDSRLYKELGYSELNNYCKSELGMSDRTAYKYISIAENFAADDNLVKSSSLIGREKLALLAKLDEPQREELQQTVNVEDVSVKELKAKIDDLKKANDRLMGKVAEAEDKAAMSRKSEEVACGKLSILRTDAEMKEQKIAQLTAKLNAEAARSAELENQVEELENRPVDVLIHNNDEEIDRLTAQFQEELEKRDKDTEQRLEQQRQLHKKQLQKLSEKYEKEADEAIAENDKELTEKAQFDCTIRFAEDALRRLIKLIMVLDNVEYTRLAVSRIETVFAILKKYEEEK